MTNLPTTPPRVLPRLTARRRFGAATRLCGAALGNLKLTLALALAVAGGTLGIGGGCQNRAGMTCQQQSDCTPGLLCNKPPAASAQGYGICEPGLKGLGERCIGSAECSTGLLCSTELGHPSEDGWHGSCEVGSLPDGSTLDLNGAADLGATD